MIASRIDVAERARELMDSGLTQLTAFLAGDVAESLHETLRTGVDWRFVLNHQGRHHEVHPLQVAAMDAAAREAIAKGIVAGARRGFQYAYDNFPVGDLVASGSSVPATLAAFHQRIVGGEFVDFFRNLTGESRIRQADVQATRYRPGHFLTTHDDRLEGQERFYAWVLSLTRGWRPEFGGLLLLHDADGQVERGLTPGFNVLSLFRVPRPHSVSQVASFAPGFRYSLTGWLKA